MRRFFPYISVLVIFFMAPGASQIVENVSQLMTDGPAAQASADVERGSHNDESGCSGTFHMCQCHSSVSFLTGSTAPKVAVAPEHRQNVAWDVDDVCAEGCRAGMFRPPAA